DKEGFLRSTRSLIQTSGRAARNVNGKVILYADKETDSIKAAVGEMERRRTKQRAFNTEHGITPTTVVRAIRDGLHQVVEADYLDLAAEASAEYAAGGDLTKRIAELRVEMREAAKELEFERAAELRDEVRRLEAMELGIEEPADRRGRTWDRAGDPGVHPRTNSTKSQRRHDQLRDGRKKRGAKKKPQ
ncbi:MAG: UvrB/UvrC motif-containing protein, partial [Planctomycetota bacterium]